MFRFRSRGTPHHSDRTDVADECESFLSGEYVNRLLCTHQEVPPWAWMNLTAHASHGRLVELAAISEALPVIRADHYAWRMAVRSIATEVLAAHETTAMTIEEIQALALVPIEFALMTTPVGPRTTLRLVEHALGRAAR